MRATGDTMVTREIFEGFEHQRLAPYASRSAGTLGRRHAEGEDPFRTAFQRDRDRIVHSAAFRRLGNKTQVFLYDEGDHYRTRLPHTLEVSQIARSIARILSLNEDLAEAIVLAHDLGHTPFGHSGEEVMDVLMADQGGYDHNLHSLRIVDTLEVRYPTFAGLNLTYETREGLAKHSTPYDEPPPVPEFSRPGFPVLEAQVADLSDEIAYNAHDVDDGLRSGILSFDDLEGVALWRECAAAVRAAHDGIDGDVLRARVVSAMMSSLVCDLADQTARNIAADRIASPHDARACRNKTVSFSPDTSAKKTELAAFLMRRLYTAPRLVQTRQKVHKIIEDLFRGFCSSPEQLPANYQRRIPDWGAKRVVCDYVSGMTDRFAIEEHKRMYDPHFRV